jgi:hypothetical protein
VPPQEGLEWFAGREAAPSAILLSNRHHYRESDDFLERFACKVHCNRLGLHEFSGGQNVELLAACARLLEEIEFFHLLLAHGGPVIGDGRDQLRELVEGAGRTAFEM